MNISHWNTLYRESIERGFNIVEKINGVMLGFNTNIDAIKYVDEMVLQKFSGVRPASERSNKIEKSIFTLSDLFEGLLHCMENGVGEEWQIIDASVYNWLNHNFHPNSLTIGGQSGIMANVASNLGVKKVILNAPVVPRLLKDLLNEKILIPKIVDDNFRLFSIREIPSDNDGLIHWIFEFKKGFKVVTHEKNFVVPESRRFIATYDPVNSEVVIDSAFIEAGKRFAKKTKGAVLGGHHLLKPNKSSDYYIKKALTTRNIIEMWKSENPNFLIKYELGFFLSKTIADIILKFILNYVDIIGINEQELYQLVNVGISQSRLTPKERINLILKSLTNLKNTAKPKVGIHFHSMTLDFFYLLNPDVIRNTKDVEKIHSSISLAALMTSVTALTGSVMRKREILKYAEDQKNFIFTRVTKEMLDALVEIIDKYNGRKEEITELGYTTFNRGVLFVVPIKYAQNPIKSVGLGDTCSVTQFLSYPQ